MSYGKGKRPEFRLSNPPVHAVKRGRARSIVPSWVPFIILLAVGVGALLLLLFRQPVRKTSEASALGWSDVLLKKRSWTEAKATNQPTSAELRQQWADAVEEFSEANPEHARAREEHEALVLEQARDLARSARYEEATRLYEALVERRPADATLRAELDALRKRQTLTRDELAEVRAGMVKADVERLIGVPQPGWSRTARDVEGWYYSREGGGVAAVFFRNGKVFAVDFDGPVRPAPVPANGPPRS